MRRFIDDLFAILCKAISKLLPSRCILHDARKGAPAQNELYCAISRGWFDDAMVRAAHIVPKAVGPAALDYIIGSGAGSRLHTADNCLLMHTSVESDNGKFVLASFDANEKPIRRWKIQMTNQVDVNVDMGRTSLKELHGKEVDFKNSNRPAARFLYFHFVTTFLHNKRDRQPGWERYLVDQPTRKPFATMRPYLRRSMLLALAEVAGDLDQEYEASVLGSEGVELFTEQEKLSDKEEEKVARRTFLTYDGVRSDQDVVRVTEEVEDLEQSRWS